MWGHKFNEDKKDPPDIALLHASSAQQTSLSIRNARNNLILKEVISDISRTIDRKALNGENYCIFKITPKNNFYHLKNIIIEKLKEQDYDVEEHISIKCFSQPHYTIIINW